VPEIRVRVRPVPGTLLDTAVLMALPGVTGVWPDADDFVLELSESAAVPGVVRAVAALPTDLLGVAEEPPTLEEAYLRLVESLREGSAA
jgi:ABC-2 type transport system ATP-binding protein